VKINKIKLKCHTTERERIQDTTRNKCGRFSHHKGNDRRLAIYKSRFSSFDTTILSQINIPFTVIGLARNISRTFQKLGNLLLHRLKLPRIFLSKSVFRKIKTIKITNYTITIKQIFVKSSVTHIIGYRS